jgi:hypothetical protein
MVSRSTGQLSHTLASILAVPGDQLRRALAHSGGLLRTGLLRAAPYAIPTGVHTGPALTLGDWLEPLEGLMEALTAESMEPLSVFSTSFTKPPPATLTPGDSSHLDSGFERLRLYLEQVPQEATPGGQRAALRAFGFREDRAGGTLAEILWG